MTQHPTRQLVVAHRPDITEKPRAGSYLRVVRPLTDRTVGQSAVGCDDCVKLRVAQRADLQFFRIPSQLDATNAEKLGLRIHPLSVRVRLSTVFGAIPLEAHRDLDRRRFCPWQPQLRNYDSCDDNRDDSRSFRHQRYSTTGPVERQQRRGNAALTDR